MRELEIAKLAALAGGKVATRYFREGVSLREKQDKSYNLVTEADVESEQEIVRVIHEHYPGHAILAEENFHDAAVAQRLWVVDPIDGTTNFAHGIPHFAISIAYFEDAQPVCGVIYNPARDEWFEAVHGQGAFFNGAAARVGEQDQFQQALFALGFYYDRGAMMEATLAALRDLFLKDIRGMRRMGTASLDLAQVGMGMYGAYFEFELSPWDFAAGQLFVTEAGGKITTCTGDPLPLAKTSVLATNGHLHEPTLEIVKRHFLNFSS